MRTTTEKTSIHLPKDLYEKIRKRVTASHGEFQSAEEYIEFVLREVVKEDDDEPEEAYTPEEEKEIMKRLRSLGYM